MSEESIQILEEAVTLFEQGKYDKAIPGFKRVQKIMEQSLGPTHPNIDIILGYLSTAYEKSGKYEEMLRLWKRSLSLYESNLGPSHPDVAAKLYRLALVYGARYRFKEALPLLKRAVSIAETTLGADHPDTKKFKEYLEVSQWAID